MPDHLFVVTGGPGSGKTSLIDALAALGYRTMPEAGRAIIQDQIRIGGDALPWADRAAFAEHMLGWELRSHREGRAMKGPILLDRGVPDVIGYLELYGLPVPTHMRKAAELYRYNRRVFIAPFWPDIFAQDAERKQTAEEAAATGRVLTDVYAELGYELIQLPRCSVSERADFVRDQLAMSA
jgi:predicted ATPase